MGRTKVSSLPAIGELTESDEIYVVSNGSSMKASVGTLTESIGGGGGTDMVPQYMTPDPYSMSAYYIDMTASALSTSSVFSQYSAWIDSENFRDSTNPMYVGSSSKDFCFNCSKNMFFRFYTKNSQTGIDKANVKVSVNSIERPLVNTVSNAIPFELYVNAGDCVYVAADSDIEINVYPTMPHIQAEGDPTHLWLPGNTCGIFEIAAKNPDYVTDIRAYLLGPGINQPWKDYNIFGWNTFRNSYWHAMRMACRFNVPAKIKAKTASSSTSWSTTGSNWCSAVNTSPELESLERVCGTSANLHDVDTADGTNGVKAELKKYLISANGKNNPNSPVRTSYGSLIEIPVGHWLIMDYVYGGNIGNSEEYESIYTDSNNKTQKGSTMWKKVTISPYFYIDMGSE